MKTQTINKNLVSQAIMAYWLHNESKLISIKLFEIFQICKNSSLNSAERHWFNTRGVSSRFYSQHLQI